MCIKQKFKTTTRDLRIVYLFYNYKYDIKDNADPAQI